MKFKDGDILMSKEYDFKCYIVSVNKHKNTANIIYLDDCPYIEYFEWSSQSLERVWTLCTDIFRKEL